MNIEQEFETYQDTFYILKHWEEHLKEMERTAIWGTHPGYDDIKVMTTKTSDRQENKVIDYLDSAKKFDEIFEKHYQASKNIDNIIDKYAKCEDYISLLEYKTNLIQFKKSSKPKAALKRVQEAIDKEARIKTYPIKVQKLLKGEKVKHRDCEEGFYFFAEERANIYIFQCDCCGKRVKIYK